MGIELTFPFCYCYLITVVGGNYLKALTETNPDNTTATATKEVKETKVTTTERETKVVDTASTTAKV